MPYLVDLFQFLFSAIIEFPLNTYTRENLQPQSCFLFYGHRRYRVDDRVDVRLVKISKNVNGLKIQSNCGA